MYSAKPSSKWHTCIYHWYGYLFPKQYFCIHDLNVLTLETYTNSSIICDDFLRSTEISTVHYKKRNSTPLGTFPVFRSRSKRMAPMIWYNPEGLGLIKKDNSWLVRIIQCIFWRPLLHFQITLISENNQVANSNWPRINTAAFIYLITDGCIYGSLNV